MRGQIRGVRRSAAVGAMLVAALATGCSSVGEGIANQVLEDQGVQVDLDGESVTVEGPDGQTITAGAGIPEAFPDDFPLPDGAVASGGVTGADAQFDIVVSLQVPDTSVEEVADFYRQALPAAGYEITQDVSGGSNSVLSIAGNGFTGDVVSNPAGDQVQLAITLDEQQ